MVILYELLGFAVINFEKNYVAYEKVVPETVKAKVIAYALWNL